MTAALRSLIRLAVRLAAGLALALSLLACALHVTNSGAAPVPPQGPDSLRIATHNVHYIRLRQETGRWSRGDWERRKPALDAAFKAMAADIVAFQEMESFAGGDDGSVNLARDYLLARNPGYAAAASGDWRSFPSTQPVFYRTARLEVLDQGWFFFSTTPEVIYSRSFDGSYPAFASWVRFGPRGGGPAFTLFNVHFEYDSPSNKRLSAQLVASRMAPRLEAGEAVVLAGDINAWTGSEVAQILAAPGLRFAPVRGATYHFDRGLNVFGPIDHLAFSRQFRLEAGPVVLRRQFGGQWPSDHYPVFVDVTLAP